LLRNALDGNAVAVGTGVGEGEGGRKVEITPGVAKVMAAVATTPMTPAVIAPP
jgi:hypothetical protein